MNLVPIKLLQDFNLKLFVPAVMNINIVIFLCIFALSSGCSSEDAPPECIKCYDVCIYAAGSPHSGTCLSEFNSSSYLQELFPTFSSIQNHMIEEEGIDYVDINYTEQIVPVFCRANYNPNVDWEAFTESLYQTYYFCEDAK